MTSTFTIQWKEDRVCLIDQTRLPLQYQEISCRNLDSLIRAIRQLKVRGAPALGVAAAFGVLLGIRTFRSKDRRRFERHVDAVCRRIGASRPTAVNLFAALEAMREVIRSHPDADINELKARLRARAFEIFEEDRRVCRKLGDHGARLIKNGINVLTVCNAGALATVDYGTALGVFYSAHRLKKTFRVYACETRPLLQGSRLTAWELMRAGIDTTLICDNMAATLMRQGKVSAVFTGADRIAANGDTANKIGTYMLAVLAQHHRIPFYVAAPQTTFDLNIRSGSEIPIEERAPSEVRGFGGKQTAPERVRVFNPAFDVTDFKLITAFVTEKGIVHPPFKKNIKQIFS